MNLFKKFITKQESSYALGNIGEKYVKLGKIDYQGSLDKLFREDVDKFIEYNIRDVEIIVELEKSLKFIELSVTICHLCHTPYETIYYSTVLNDGAILTYLKRKGIVSPNKPTTYNPGLKEIKEEYAGGYLKDPVPGLYEWVIDLDFTSLYPSIIRSLNMGIETLVGRVVNTGKFDNQWSLRELKKKYISLGMDLTGDMISNSEPDVLKFYLARKMESYIREKAFTFSKDELLKTDSKEEYENALLQAQQSTYIADKWAKLDQLLVFHTSVRSVSLKLSNVTIRNVKPALDKLNSYS